MRKNISTGSPYDESGEKHDHLDLFSPLSPLWMRRIDHCDWPIALLEESVTVAQERSPRTDLKLITIVGS